MSQYLWKQCNDVGILSLSAFKFLTNETTTAVRKGVFRLIAQQKRLLLPACLHIFSSCHLDVGCLVLLSVVPVGGSCLLLAGCRVCRYRWLVLVYCFRVLIVGCRCRLSLTFILSVPCSAPCYMSFTRGDSEMFAFERHERCCKACKKFLPVLFMM